MNYIWEKFNIKTFPAETIVFTDGVFQADLSTLKSTIIDKKFELPVHLIFIGEIAGKNDINLSINVENQPVFITVKITNKFPAFLNIFIKNAGDFSQINADIIAQNHSELEIDVFSGHFAKNTGNFIKTRVIAHGGTKTKLNGVTHIEKDISGIESDMTFSALADPGAKITFSPKQRIYAAPKLAGHSANIYRPMPTQIQYLRTAGLGTMEITEILNEAFINA